MIMLLSRRGAVGGYLSVPPIAGVQTPDPSSSFAAFCGPWELELSTPMLPLLAASSKARLDWRSVHGISGAALCSSLGELKVARIHDIRFISCLGCGVCVQRSKGATTDKLHLTVDASTRERMHA